MIVPIGHEQMLRRLPWVTFSIIAVCTLVQIYASATTDDDAIEQLISRIDDAPPDQAPELEAQLHELVDHSTVMRFGYFTGSGIRPTMISSAFVHEGWLHLIGNMWFLLLAGSAVEDRWGRGRFLAFYLAGAALSAFGFDAFHKGEPIILVGASGAVSAAMGAFLVCFARTRIRLWTMWYGFGRGFANHTFYVRAYVALPLWLLEQVVLGALGDEGGGAVAYAAHVAGFAFGAVVALIARQFGDTGDTDDDDEVDASLPRAKVERAAKPARPLPPPAGFEDRHQRCMSAIDIGDIATVRTTASRMVLDLAGARDRSRILELYRAIADRLDRVPLTDNAFVAAVDAAEAEGDRQAFVAIATGMQREQPRSQLLPKVMWRLAEHHRADGRADLATATLEALAAQFPRDPLGVRAREALAAPTTR